MILKTLTLSVFWLLLIGYTIPVLIEHLEWSKPRRNQNNA